MATQQTVEQVTGAGIALPVAASTLMAGADPLGLHGLMIDFGWKIKISHIDVPPDSPPSERIKGIVLTISPWKDLP